jgi:hypothetical protein
MGVSVAVKTVLGEFQNLTNLKTSGVVGVSHSDEGWVVSIEMLEKKSIPDSMDVLGLYEVKVDDHGKIVDFSRVKLRKRGDTVEG